MYLQKEISQKNFLKVFVAVLKVTDKKKQDPDPNPDSCQSFMDLQHRIRYS
jgi:hypothetical protein